MIRGLVSGIFMGALLLMFGVVMMSALLPILRPLPVPDAVSQVASDAAPGSSGGAGVDSAATDTVAPEPNGAQVGPASGSATDTAASDRPRQIAALPAVPGAGAPPAKPADTTPTRPDVAGGGVARSVPDPLSGQSGAGSTDARGNDAAALPGTREAARPQAPRRDAAPAAATGAGAQAETPPAQSPSAAAPVTGTGLPVPDRDTAPAARFTTTPPARPETGAGIATVSNPQADASPAAPSASLSPAPGNVAPPPAAPRAPAADAALTAPGLPGRTLQSTPVRPGTAPQISDVAPRFGQVDPGPRPGPGVAAPLPGPGTVASLPDVGAPATQGIPATSDASEASGTPAPVVGGSSGPAATANTTGATPAPPARALPRVRRPGGGNGQGNEGPAFGRSGSGGPAFDGPMAPTAPAIEERALPAPGFSGLRSGVRTGRLPQIGSDGAGAAGDGAAPQSPPETPAETLPGAAPAAAADPDSPLVYNAAAFANPDGRPSVAVILLDDGEGVGRDRLAALDLPVTVAIDPLSPGAAALAERYRAAGKEVLILASALPPGARAVDVEVSLAGMFAAVPSAVGLLDMAEGGFQNDRITARHVVEVLGAEGYGLLTHDRGLNAAAQLAEQAGLSVGRVFRVLDAEGEDEDTIRRHLDRAVLRAGQQGAVIVMGHNRPETLAALIGWTMEGRARSVALAPVTAALIRR